jgi:predicted Holliday junction resolvase-like endonuclease
MDISLEFLPVMVLGLALGVAIFVIVNLSRQLSHEKFRNRSLSSKYGKLTEQFLPLVPTYPWDPGNFRFLGSPIDGIQFEDEKIILVEFKSGNSQLSKHQRRLMNIVKAGNVYFEVIRVG